MNSEIITDEWNRLYVGQLLVMDIF